MGEVGVSGKINGAERLNMYPVVCMKTAGGGSVIVFVLFLNAAVTFVCLFISCHLFVTLSSMPTLPATLLILFVTVAFFYFCFCSCVELLPCIIFLLHDTLFACMSIS